MSARGDSITWLHEGSSSGPGGSAGLHAMQVLQVLVSPVSGFSHAMHFAQHVHGADCLHDCLVRADEQEHMPHVAWHAQHGSMSRAGWGSHTVCHQLLADR